jgi:hypothetical protein
MAGVIREFAIELAAFADIVKHQHAAGHRPGAVADGRGTAFDVQLVAVATDQQCGPYRLDGMRAANGHRQWIFQRLAGFFVKAAEYLINGTPHGVLDTPAGQGLGHRIQILHLTVCIGGNHTIANRLQRDLRRFLFAKQGLFIEFVFGDVQLHTHQAFQLPAASVKALARAVTQRHSPER